MFFFFDIEKRIGLKKLSNADLGTSDTSRQTHIGLYNDVLQFLRRQCSNDCNARLWRLLPNVGLLF